MQDLKKIIFLLITISVFLSAGCQKHHDIDKLKAEINSINEKLSKAILENDHDTPLKLYTEDAISLPSYQPMIKGMEALKEAAEKQIENPMNMKTFKITSTDVWVSGMFVVDIGTYSLTMEMPDAPGGEMKDQGKYLTLFEIQRDGSLLMKADTWNTDFNPWEAMMQDHGGEDKDKS